MFKKPEARTGSVGQYKRVLVPEANREEKPGRIKQPSWRQESQLSPAVCCLNRAVVPAKRSVLKAHEAMISEFGQTSAPPCQKQEPAKKASEISFLFWSGRPLLSRPPQDDLGGWSQGTESERTAATWTGRLSGLESRFG
jgi:hypothetical protein